MKNELVIPKLVNILKHPTKKKLRKESKKQGKELKRYSRIQGRKYD